MRSPVGQFLRVFCAKGGLRSDSFSDVVRDYRLYPSIKTPTSLVLGTSGA
jgi:hypothetical protein